MNKTILLILISFQCFTTVAQSKFKVYFFSVGSEHYEQDSKKFKEKNFIPYDNLPEAQASAIIMSKLFSQFASGKGITLLSTAKNKITKKTILKGLDSLHKMISKDNSKDPLVIFYYCGHGISENLAWNQFLIPGTYTSVAGNKSIDNLYKDLIFLGDITDKLVSLKYRYILMADCCRKEEKDNSFPEARLRYFFEEKNVETLKILSTALKILNEYHQQDPVIFSIAPGNSTPTVNLPKNELTKLLQSDTSLQVGPLCRRSMLLINDILNESVSDFSLQQFVEALTKSDFDLNLSPESISYYTKEEDKKKTFIIFSRKVSN